MFAIISGSSAWRRPCAWRAACPGGPRAPALTSSRMRSQSSSVERADVDAVDRGHRRDLARAEALEGAHVEVRVAAEHVLHRARRARRRRAASTRCSCTRRRPSAPLGRELEHVVEARDGDQVGGRQAQHAGGLLHRRRRQPAVLALDDLHRRDRGASGCPGTCAISASIAVAHVRGHVRRRGIGDDRRVLREVDGAVPARDARAVGVALDLRSDRSPSAVDPPEDRVEHRQRHDQVGDVEVLHHRLEAPAGSRSEGSRMCTRAGLEEPSERTKQRELAARGLDRVVRLARRHAEALGHELEVVDQRLHRGRQLVPRRQRVLAVGGDVVALGQAVERLVDDLAATRASRPSGRGSGRSCRRPCRPGS